MARPRKTLSPTPTVRSAATVGYEAQLRQMAGGLRGTIDAADYDDACGGQSYLASLSDSLDEKHCASRRTVRTHADPLPATATYCRVRKFIATLSVPECVK